MPYTDELKRLEALLSYEILDTPEEEEYANIVSLAASILGVPDAYVTLLGKDQQWIKSATSGGAHGTSLDVSFCRHMIPTGEPLVVEDASQHDLFKEYENVTGSPHIRFYAGVPFEAPEGGVLGALCVTDTKPRQITEAQLKSLKVLSQQVRSLLELRRTSIRLQKALAEATEARKSRDLFFASVSHDIRTPAAAIVGASEVLAKQKLDEESCKLVAGIESNGKTLTMLLNNLLDLAKMDAGKFELVESVFNLRALVREVIDGQIPVARSKNVDLTWSYDRSLGNIFKGDPLRIRQILGNLLSNAVKFTRHGTVRLSVTKAETGINLRITDSGIGIPTDRLDAIMGEYEQADASTHEHYGGSGLGLSIVWKLTSLMKGHLDVQSVVGRGSVFSVTLPLPSFELSQTVAGLKNALIVEDSEVNRIIVDSLLKQSGIQADQAATARDARRLLTLNKYDLILLDERLPDGLGTDVAREVRSNSLNAETTIIGISAASDESQVRFALEAGMNGFLAKPFTLEQLETTIMAAPKTSIL
jgi:signal transduction histidine kinase/ActR/RegA family two-component response regulator